MDEGSQNSSVTTLSLKPPEFGECPLCLTSLDSEDVDFRPCSCAFKLCRFCWYRLFLSKKPNCPGCRNKYSRKSSIVQLGRSIIPRIEAVRTSLLMGSQAFEMLNVISYFDYRAAIPTAIFTSYTHIIELLSEHDLITSWDEDNHRILVKEEVQVSVRRSADTEATLAKAIEYLMAVMDPYTIVNNVYRKKKIVNHYDFDFKCYLTHSISVWNHVLKFEARRLRPLSITFFNCLFDRLEESGRCQQALILCEKTEPWMTRSFGPMHLNTLRTKVDQGTALWRLNRMNEALQIFNQVLLEAEASLGRHHWLVLNILNEMTFIFNSKGQYSKSLQISDDVIERFASNYGSEDADTLVFKCNKAQLLSKLGQHLHALKLFQKVYEAEARLFGEMDHGAIEAEFWVATELLRMKKYDAALTLYRDIYEKRKKELILDEIEILCSAVQITDCLNGMEDFEEAVKFSEDNLDELKAMKPPSDVSHIKNKTTQVAKLQVQRGQAYLGLEQFKMAERILSGAADILKKQCGANNATNKLALKLLRACRQANPTTK